MNIKAAAWGVMVALAVLAAPHRLEAVSGDRPLPLFAKPQTLTAPPDTNDLTVGSTLDEFNPYGAISNRNVFHLQPLPPPEPKKEEKKSQVEEVKVKLTGFIREVGKPPRALFVCAAKDPLDTTYYNLTEGEHDGPMELVRILEDKEGAEVIHENNRMTLLLQDNKPEPGVGGGPGASSYAPLPQNTAMPTGGSVMVGGASPMVLTNTAKSKVNVGGPGMGTAANNANLSDNPTIAEQQIIMAADAMLHQSEIAEGKYPPTLPAIQSLLDNGIGDEGTTSMPSIPASSTSSSSDENVISTTQTSKRRFSR